MSSRIARARRRAALALLLAAAIGACAPRERPPAAETAVAAAVVPAPSSAAVDSAAARAVVLPDDSALARYYDRVHALVQAGGCTRREDCRVLPVGVRGCGGPQEHVIYCARTTDSTRLAAAIAALDDAQRAYNAKHQVASTCEMRLPPVAELANGRCVAGGRSGGAGKLAVP